MAKQVQLKQNGVEIYPQTITQAIADTTKGKLLSTIITELYSGITKETNDRIAAIQGLDYTGTSAVTGQYVKTITETDGIIAATFGKVAASEVSNNGAEGSAIADDETVQDALDTLAAKAAAITILNEDGTINVTPSAAGTDINVNIKSNDLILSKSAGSGITSTLNLVKITSGLPATIKERYQLQGINGAQIGQNVDIAKDSHIVSINYITTGEHAQNLEYVYIDASGATKTTYVDMSSLVLEAEFASGVTITNHIAHGVVDTASEKDSQATPQDFLTVGADGFKVSGIKDEIDRKINALDATVSGQNNSVKVTVVEGEGKLTSATVEVTDAVVTFANSALTINGNSTDIVTKAGAEAIKSYVDAKTGSLDSNVSGQTADGFIKVEVNQADGALNYVHVSGKTQAVASASSSAQGLAEASDVKAYVTNQIEALDANVSGESGAVKVQVVEANGIITNVNVTATTANMADAGLTGTELAKTKDVKDYVDSAITKTAIIDSADIDATESADGTSLAIKYGSIASGATSAVTGGSIFAWGVTAENKKDVADFTWPTV